MIEGILARAGAGEEAAGKEAAGEKAAERKAAERKAAGRKAAGRKGKERKLTVTSLELSASSPSLSPLSFPLCFKFTYPPLTRKRRRFTVTFTEQ